VPVEWPEALELAATELKRVISTHGNRSIYGGSYGWASAGRFHHAQSQLRRFLNGAGGFTRSVNTYSLGAAAVIIPHVLGKGTNLFQFATGWPVIAEHTELFVSFGGVPLKNTAVSPGGVSRHAVRGHLQRAKERGVEFVCFSPLRDDLVDVDATWHPLIPGSDVAVMLGLAYVLASEGLHDRDFLDRYTTGYERFERYLLGKSDGQPKTPEWAESISSVPAGAVRELARAMVSKRTLVTVSWSLQRTDHGEQAPWMGAVLAAMVGQIGLPGGGFGHGYGSMAEVGAGPLPFDVPTFPHGRNPVSDFIPVARVADMLLHPNEPFDYDGRQRVYPDIKLVYWAGGNPFHHHQDLGRLRRAFGRAETIIVHEPYWTPTARHADIVFPSTVSLEREDIGGSRNDPCLIAMHKAVEPYAQARNDHDTYSDLAELMGFRERFTENKTIREWLTEMYEGLRERVSANHDLELPPFEEFWEEGYLELPTQDDLVALESFRDDPAADPLETPSGKIEIFSGTIAGFGYDDCPGHPTWLEPAEWLGSPRTARFPLHLIANNPKTRLHGQLDIGGFSQGSKVQGREPVRMHQADAAARGIADGDVVRVFNERGSCLAGVVVCDDIRAGVVQLSTGAWYDPLDPADPNSMCVHGNPNVLTFDRGTSRLAQGCSGQHALVEIERWTGDLPPIRAHTPPPTVARDAIHPRSSS
jgi:biotin/methionine sulfoxide reductase